MDRSEVLQREYTFGSHTLSVYSRKYAKDTTKVSISMQVTVKQIWDSFWNFGDVPAAAAPIVPCPGTEKEVPVAVTAGADPPDLLGLDIWPGALALCNFLATRADLVHGRRVVELGAGMGLPSLLAAKLGSLDVLITDYEPMVMELLEENIVLNGVQTCSTQTLDWKHPARTLSASQLHAFHIVLAADVLYDADVVLPFVGVLQCLLHPEGIALVAHQTRRPLVIDPVNGIPCLSERDEPYEAFQEAVRAAGLMTRVLAMLDVGSSVGPLFLTALAWDAAYVAALDSVPPMEAPSLRQSLAADLGT